MVGRRAQLHGSSAAASRSRSGLRMLTQVGGEHLRDRPVQLGRVPGDLLQRVDGADSDVELLAAELIDGPREARAVDQ